MKKFLLGLAIFLLTICVILTMVACTLSFENIDIPGKGEDIGKQTPTTEVEASPTVSIPAVPQFIPGIKNKQE